MGQALAKGLGDVLDAVTKSPIVFAVIGLAVFAGVLIVLAGNRVRQVLRGALRALGSCFYSPVLWLRKALLGIADFACGKEGDDLESDQYLLNRFLRIVQVGIVVVAVATLASSLTESLRALVPEKGVRAKLGALSAERDSLGKELRQAEKALKEAEKNWRSTGADRIREFRARAEARLKNAQQRMESLANALQGSRFLREVRSKLEGVRPEDGPERILQARREAEEAIESFWIWDRSVVKNLSAYAEAWQERMTAEYQARVVTDEQIRELLLEDLAVAAKQARERYDAKRRQIKEFQKEVGVGLVAAVEGLVIGVLQFLITLWFFGCLVEWLWLFIRLADNVRVLRERSSLDQRT
jgi:hypothetical protein